MDDVKFMVGVKERRKRAELTLPSLTFHHLDSWRKTIGNDAFLAWQVLYTLADRKAYPETHVIHLFDYTRLAERFGCKKDKALQLIKTLFEYGLIEICEQKNKYGGTTNLYVWCDVPFYSETTYCTLEKRRLWEERNSEGQKLAAMRKINQKESRSEKSNGSEPYGNSEREPYEKTEREPYEKTERQPFGKTERESFGKTECINNTNNNNSNNNNQSFNHSVSLSIKEDEKSKNNKGLNDGLNQADEIINYAILKLNNVPRGKVEELKDWWGFWSETYGMDAVKYAIDRLAEQTKRITSIASWIKKALEKPYLYPPKIGYEKDKEDDSLQKSQLKKKNLMRSMYS